MMHFFGGDFVHGNELCAAAAFHCAQVRLFVSETACERAQQETAETSTRRRSTAQRFILNYALEKNLCQILSLIPIKSPLAQISVNRWPIHLAELSQRLARVRFRSVAGSEHNAPCRLA